MFIAWIFFVVVTVLSASHHADIIVQRAADACSCACAVLTSEWPPPRADIEALLAPGEHLEPEHRWTINGDLVCTANSDPRARFLELQRAVDELSRRGKR
jgi:hypothetical protein